MDTDHIIQERPHLKDIFRLYGTVQAFVSSVLDDGIGGIGPEVRCYPASLVDKVCSAFSSSFDVPEESLSPIRDAMRQGRLDFTRLPLDELPSFSLPFHEEEVRTILFLISRPFFTRLREVNPVDNLPWTEGRCPLCHGKPVMAKIETEERRRLHCSFCGTDGYYPRLGCPLCRASDTGKIVIFTSEQEEGFRIDACDSCGSYMKTITSSSGDMNFDVADLVSMPLDIVAQRKGYVRPSPNPVGMISIL